MSHWLNSPLYIPFLFWEAQHTSSTLVCYSTVFYTNSWNLKEAHHYDSEDDCHKKPKDAGHLEPRDVWYQDHEYTHHVHLELGDAHTKGPAMRTPERLHIIHSDKPTHTLHLLSEAVSQAKSRLEHKEIVGMVCVGKQGIGYNGSQQWWSKAKKKDKRDMPVQEIRNTEEGQRHTKAVSMQSQGDWMKWEEVLPQKITWSELWKMEPLRIKFCLRVCI